MSFTSDELRIAALNAMERRGVPLTRISTNGRAQLYRTADGRVVRLRTNNDRLVIAATSDTSPEARLDLEGCDLLLVAVPQHKRERGPIEVYLVPIGEVRRAFAHAHADWLASNPQTAGDNRTWQLALDNGKPVSASHFADTWRCHRLEIPS